MTADLAEVMAEEIYRFRVYPFRRHWTMDADYIQLAKHYRVLAERWRRARKTGYYRKQSKPGRPRSTSVAWRLRKAERVIKTAADVAAKRAVARAFFGM